jgi:hypothetical protein
VSLQGLVLVFDMTVPDSFLALRVWEDLIEKMQPSVLLCVGNKLDVAGSAVTDEQRDIWLNWCFEHGLEMIECSALHDEVRFVGKGAVRLRHNT